MTPLRPVLKGLSKRKHVVIKAADKGGAVVVWRTDLYRQEAFRQLSDTSFYAKVDKDLTSANQTSGSVRIVRGCFSDVTTILPPLSLLFSVYQWVIRSRMWLHDRERQIDGFRKSSLVFEKKYAIINLGNRVLFRNNRINVELRI